MDFQELIVKIAKILETLDISYAITGGYAVSIWGRPRATFDIDVIIEIPKLKAIPFTRALKKISKMSFIDEEYVLYALEKKDEFNFIHGDSGIKVDFWILKGDEFDKSRMKRRIAKTVDGQSVYFASPEDVILKKLLWFKESQSTRHLEDIESIIRIQRRLDIDYLKEWARRLKVTKLLNEALAKENL